MQVAPHLQFLHPPFAHAALPQTAALAFPVVLAGFA